MASLLTRHKQQLWQLPRRKASFNSITSFCRYVNEELEAGRGAAERGGGGRKVGDGGGERRRTGGGLSSTPPTPNLLTHPSPSQCVTPSASSLQAHSPKVWRPRWLDRQMIGWVTVAGAANTQRMPCARPRPRPHPRPRPRPPLTGNVGVLVTAQCY